MRHRAVPAVLLVALLGVLVSACGSSGAKSSVSSTTKPVTTTTAQVIVAPTVTVNGQAVKVPTENGTDPIKSFGDTGQHVILSSSGVLPRSLYASLNTPVVWTNLTAHPVTLTLKNVPGVTPQVIQPGASWSWNPVTALSFAYTSSAGGTGYVYSGLLGP